VFAHLLDTPVEARNDWKEFDIVAAPSPPGMEDGGMNFALAFSIWADNFLAVALSLF
jgi:hypothetical protein